MIEAKDVIPEVVVRHMHEREMTFKITQSIGVSIGSFKDDRASTCLPEKDEHGDDYPQGGVSEPVLRISHGFGLNRAEWEQVKRLGDRAWNEFEAKWANVPFPPDAAAAGV